MHYVADLGNFNQDSQDIDYEVDKYKHKSILCKDQPLCEPKNQCRYIWNTGADVKNTLLTNQRITVDSEGE